ncbi:MAG: UDP-N-acetylglucosamine 1-carboxyvinyltransferase [Patescibacteria group bacterium]
MATRLLIDGGRPLEGRVVIQGSKNAALPLIAASLLTEEPVRLENIPDIRDVRVMADMVGRLGAEINWDRDGHVIAIRAKALTSSAPDPDLTKKLRGSILLSGALLGRLRQVTLPHPGGDAIGARPLQTHFRALEALGAQISAGESITIDGMSLHGGDVTLEEPSVTATENTILAAVLAPGKTVLRLAAYEPHVQELVAFLQKMGGEIRWRENLQIEINGSRRLGGAQHRINPDELEISSFATLAAATRSDVTLEGIDPQYLDAVFLQLGKMGVAYERNGSSLRITPPRAAYQSFRVQSGLYPKLGSDHLPPFAVLATQAEGTSLIHDWLYEKRLNYIPELQKMGANCRILDPHRAVITGPTPLTGCEILSLDIRSGMTLDIAGLAAQGRTTIAGVGHLERGYERLEERLLAIGADIKRVNE